MALQRTSSRVYPSEYYQTHIGSDTAICAICQKDFVSLEGIGEWISETSCCIICQNCSNEILSRWRQCAVCEFVPQVSQQILSHGKGKPGLMAALVCCDERGAETHKNPVPGSEDEPMDEEEDAICVQCGDTVEEILCERCKNE